MKLQRVAAVVGSSLILGCATWTLVKAERVEMGDLYTVNPGITWNARKDGDVVTWTVDGPFLQSVIFFNEIEDGDPIIPELHFGRSREDEEIQRFRSDMDFLEIQELIVATWANLDWHAIQTQNLRPAPFGPFEGFRFELECVSDTGLEYRGAVAGAVVDEELYIVAFRAPTIYAYEDYSRRFEAILASIREP